MFSDLLNIFTISLLVFSYQSFPARGNDPSPPNYSVRKRPVLLFSCVFDLDIFMKRGINPPVFLNIKSASLISANVFYLFLVNGVQSS